MGKKEITTIIFDLEHETFIIYVALFSSTPLTDIDIYLSCRPQIGSFIGKKVSIKIFIKYTHFVDIFSLDLTSELPKHIRINNHTINLVNSY